MHGNNPIRKLNKEDDGLVLRVQGQPFHTIQGEGPFAGLPAIFIRLWGCHLRCTFCDTDFESDPQALSVTQLYDLCMNHPSDLVVLTGGEPMRQNIVPLCQALTAGFKQVQIETAGNFWWPDLLPLVESGQVVIVVSPKTAHVDETLANHVKAWKLIISARHKFSLYDGFPVTSTQNEEHEQYIARPFNLFNKRDVYVQPMDEGDPEQNKANTQKCIELALQYGYRVSLQQHKILGMP